MATTPPTKPPRGIKNMKETSGLLMSVIRTLSASETNEQRDREKSKLESEFKRSDRKLDELVACHDQDLTQVMQLFTSLSVQVTASREKIHAVKENLHACKTLLGCRRDELHKLWFEGVEHKYMLKLLDEIEQMTEVPQQLAGFLDKKHYLHATRLLASAVSLGKGTLDGVEGLRDLSVELEHKKQQLHVKILEELSHHIYVRPGEEAINLRRQGSGREAALLASPFQREAELRASSRRRNDSKARRALLDVSPQVGSEELSDSKDVVESIGEEDPEADSSHFMSILVECLALLDKVPDALETIKVQMQTELLSIVQRSTQQMIDYTNVQGQTVCSGKQSLLELLETVFEQLRRVACAHAVVLKHFARVIEKRKIDAKPYETHDYWSKVQAVLQLLLTDYLDMQNLSVEPMQPDTFTESTDISGFFARRRVPSKKKLSLFKFESSSNALTMNSYLKEGVGDASRSRDKVLVCPPDPDNITLVFLPTMRFVDEIEQILGCTPRNPCTLNEFLTKYVSDVFLNRQRKEVGARIDAAIRVPDAWKAVTPPDVMRDLNLPKPLLLSTVTVEQCMREWHELLCALPPHAERLARASAAALQSYRDTCHAAYRGIVQPHPEDRRICSAAWLKDEDINRFLKSLPNWLDLKAQRSAQTSAKGGRRRTAVRVDRPCEEEESPADVRQRNLREAEILASNLGEGGINAQEIISDMAVLKCLAQLQESMEWFSDSMRQFIADVKKEPTVSPPENGASFDASPCLSDATIQVLTGLAEDFDELANICLLVLHLEVRVQCFHFLLTKTDDGAGRGDSQEADPRVQELNRTLVSIDEAMSSSLQPRKCKYIFEGLDHLIAKILISSSQCMDEIDEPGIQRMCRNVFSLQQTLTNITMSREVALDHARHYYELFYLSPEEILSNVMEKGPEFSELEYMNAFQLLNRSRANTERGAINVHLERLSDILGEVGVTV